MTLPLILVISGLFAAGVFLCLAALARRPKPAIVRVRLESLSGPTRPSARGSSSWGKRAAGKNLPAVSRRPSRLPGPC